ncbi:activin types I and II receptor domain protein [Dictyocaulus viviparus]|uniref:Activin types I and II receptor domain protein n=1 Tax=Dictyocaulus viviparus TaxID=29172 RepID=A0A0D8XQR1_DICVI|nr:activin types I and II receptor domain protein [Dictyocaulus viviparus]
MTHLVGDERFEDQLIQETGTGQSQNVKPPTSGGKKSIKEILSAYIARKSAMRSAAHQTRNLLAVCSLARHTYPASPATSSPNLHKLADWQLKVVNLNSLNVVLIRYRHARRAFASHKINTYQTNQSCPSIVLQMKLQQNAHQTEITGFLFKRQSLKVTSAYNRTFYEPLFPNGSISIDQDVCDAFDIFDLRDDLNYSNTLALPYPTITVYSILNNLNKSVIIINDPLDFRAKKKIWYMLLIGNILLLAVFFPVTLSVKCLDCVGNDCMGSFCEGDYCVLSQYAPRWGTIEWGKPQIVKLFDMFLAVCQEKFFRCENVDCLSPSNTKERKSSAMRNHLITDDPLGFDSEGYDALPRGCMSGSLLRKDIRDHCEAADEDGNEKFTCFCNGRDNCNGGRALQRIEVDTVELLTCVCSGSHCKGDTCIGEMCSYVINHRTKQIEKGCVNASIPLVERRSMGACMIPPITGAMHHTVAKDAPDLLKTESCVCGQDYCNAEKPEITVPERQKCQTFVHAKVMGTTMKSKNITCTGEFCFKARIQSKLGHMAEYRTIGCASFTGDDALAEELNPTGCAKFSNEQLEVTACFETKDKAAIGRARANQEVREPKRKTSKTKSRKPPPKMEIEYEDDNGDNDEDEEYTEMKSDEEKPKSPKTKAKEKSEKEKDSEKNNKDDDDNEEVNNDNDEQDEEKEKIMRKERFWKMKTMKQPQRRASSLKSQHSRPFQTTRTQQW